MKSKGNFTSCVTTPPVTTATWIFISTVLPNTHTAKEQVLNQGHPLAILKKVWQRPLLTLCWRHGSHYNPIACYVSGEIWEDPFHVYCGCYIAACTMEEGSKWNCDTPTIVLYDVKKPKPILTTIVPVQQFHIRIWTISLLFRVRFKASSTLKTSKISRA